VEAARREGFDKGKREGLAEAQASREKFIASLVDTIAKSFTTLFDAEHQRAHRYESEAVHLARAIFRKLFPTLNEKHGLDEVHTVIARVLEGHREQARITIEVHPDYVEDIEKHIKTAVHSLHGAGDCTVTGDPSLGPGDCRLQWDAGGAHRTAQRLATEIEKELDQVLADKPVLHDNEYSKAAMPESDENTDSHPATAEKGETP
jgi:flagellar assembly protein FliH